MKRMTETNGEKVQTNVRIDNNNNNNNKEFKKMCLLNDGVS